jgi:probable F420-dependent oxidoreductase
VAVPRRKPLQFLADARAVTSGKELAEKARRAEAIGYHAFVIPDHLIEQLSPVVAMTWIASATERLRVAAFVFNNDLRHPAVLAQDLASLDVLSDGRLDVAIGAGWNKPEYDQIGISFDPTPVRQARLAEAIAVLKGAFADTPDGGFSFRGEHYTITGLDGQPKPVQRPHPPFMIGGGGRRTLELAGREAQIVGLAPRIRRDSGGDPQSITVEATAEKIGWVRQAAGDRFDEIVFNVYPSMSHVAVTDDVRPAVRAAKAAMAERGAAEISDEELLESPQVFIGSIDFLARKVQRLRDGLGISSFMVGEMGPLDPLVERLAGQ